MKRYVKIYINSSRMESDTKEGVYAYGVIKSVRKLKPNQDGFVPEILTAVLIDYEPEYIDAYRDRKQVEIPNWDKKYLRVREVKRFN